ncbi:MAG: hypothetical protein ACYC4Q_04515, partial [Victivallaceae bacterium]
MPVPLCGKVPKELIWFVISIKLGKNIRLTYGITAFFAVVAVKKNFDRVVSWQRLLVFVNPFFEAL